MNDNKLIAEFMGVFHQGIFPPVTIGEQMYTLDELHYHTSWDWLIPVVVKCFDEQEKVSSDLSFKLNDALLETNIQTLYEIVVEFIKEYNKEMIKNEG